MKTDKEELVELFKKIGMDHYNHPRDNCITVFPKVKNEEYEYYGFDIVFIFDLNGKYVETIYD